MKIIHICDMPCCKNEARYYSEDGFYRCKHCFASYRQSRLAHCCVVCGHIIADHNGYGLCKTHIGRRYHKDYKKPAYDDVPQIENNIDDIPIVNLMVGRLSVPKFENKLNDILSGKIQWRGLK